MEKIIKDLTDFIETNSDKYFAYPGDRFINRNALLDHLKQLKSSLPKPIEVPEVIKNTMEQYDSLQEMLTEEYYSELSEEVDDDTVQCWIDDNFDLFCSAWIYGCTVVKEPKKHVLKLDSEYYDDVVSGFKKFEIRFNDRDYKVGDILVLEEYDGIDYTGDRCKRIVTYITDYAQQDGYVVMGIEPVKGEE